MGESERRYDGMGGKDGVRAGGDGVVEEDDALGVENTECDGSGVQVDAALESVGLGAEPHHGLRGMGQLATGNSSVPVAKRP
jgi:hypothetical protein